MTCLEINKLMLDTIPEISNVFNKETEWQEGLDTGSTVVIEDVLIPFLDTQIFLNNLLISDKIFTFIEKLALFNDEYAQMLLFVSFFENVESFKKPSIFVNFFKPTTLIKYKEFLAKKDC